MIQTLNEKGQKEELFEILEILYLRVRTRNKITLTQFLLGGFHQNPYFYQFDSIKTLLFYIIVYIVTFLCHFCLSRIPFQSANFRVNEKGKVSDFYCNFSQKGT